MNTDDPHLKCHLMSQIILHICPHHHVVVLNIRCDRSCHNANENLRMVKLAAKPVQYDNDEKTWLEFRFKLENYLTLVDERIRSSPAERRVSTCGEPSDGNGRISSDHPNIESHTVRLAGDTDHGKKPETCSKSTEQKWVRSVETDGGRERAENRGSEIRDAASCATAWNE